MRIDDDQTIHNGGDDFTSTSTLSWVTLKEQGKAAFEHGEYQTAISKYGLALQPGRNCPAAERQIVLSNMVACRLKIGGPAQAEAAVENAKQCVALNDRWAKGHVRLASAYIALGGHSNDACNSLQRALQLDPGHPSARDMLIRELRRGHAASASASADSQSQSQGGNHTTHTPPEPSAPPEYFDDQNYSSTSPATTTTTTTTDENTTRQQQPQEQARNNNRPPQNPYRHQPPPQQPPLDDRVSLQDRIVFYFHRVRMWYFSQSEDVQTLLKVFVGLLLLYVAFGGRFGLEAAFGGGKKSKHHHGTHHRGNYHSGNAYDQYYEGQRRTTTSETRRGDYQYHDQSSSSSSKDTRYDSRRAHDYSSDNNDYYSSSRPRGGGGGGGIFGSSFHVPNLFDGSIHSMLILGGIYYICHRNGINPMQILFFLNMMNGGRGRVRGNRGMFGYGRGMGGMMGGMGGFGRPRW